jgi:hypothetical protein
VRKAKPSRDTRGTRSTRTISGRNGRPRVKGGSDSTKNRAAPASGADILEAAMAPTVDTDATEILEATTVRTNSAGDGATEAGTGNGQAAAAAPLDPFDPERLRLTGTPVAGTKKVQLTIQPRRPDRSWFVRAHPDPAYRLVTNVIELKEDRESYLVEPALWPALATEATLRQKLLTLAVNRQGTLFIWEANVPNEEGQRDEWARTGLEAVERATKAWVRVVANMSAGGYDLVEAAGALGEPEWPTMTLREVLAIAYKGRFIDTLEHPVLRRLRGEA